MSSEVFHRLLVIVGIVPVIVWALRWLESVRRERRVLRRLAGLVPAVEVATAGPRFDVREAVRGWGPLAGAVCAGWVLVGGAAGVVVGMAVAAGLWWWRRRQAGTATSEDFDPVEAARQLPLAADLLAACIAAGAGPVVAAQAVGEALGGPVGDALARGAAEVRLGGEPSDAWLRLAALPGAGALARLLERADVSGLPAAGPVARLAGEVRAERARAATGRARRAAVMVTAPVGLCFLPAFIAIGVLPVVIGLAGGVLGGGGAG
ncbi:type II secretion system F family protein [Streptomyces sp. SLBN-31]|jgi:pilus assembly protein TadC|uniref:type II secretion system F family protein n=1 Tax=Streptomyces sp. SLBN-31 TaxID=2768444 RepID=UPI001152A3DC|nr:type II secretion system F family protein [Streptomyces sp. SLBN-31]TQJ75490.1 type II secretion system (T2SS) protein F [Streptomyces sp. SLBN-31]